MVTLNDLERRNGPHFRLFHRIFVYDVVVKQLLGLPRFQNLLFTARRNARIASAALATAIPSVCPSATRRYCIKTIASSRVEEFALLDRKICLVL